VGEGRRKMKGIKLIALCVLASTLVLSGCVARTYNLTRDRVDQDLSSTSGNRGYLMGTAPEPAERKATRTTRVFEVELGFAKKYDTKCPATTPLANTTSTASYSEEPTMIQETQSEPVSQNFEKYTVAKNDTLQKISKKFYGTTKKWPKIYQANKDVLRSPDKLYAGQTLNIPTLGESAKMAEPTENLK